MATAQCSCRACTTRTLYFCAMIAPQYMFASPSSTNIWSTPSATKACDRTSYPLMSPDRSLIRSSPFLIILFTHEAARPIHQRTPYDLRSRRGRRLLQHGIAAFRAALLDDVRDVRRELLRERARDVHAARRGEHLQRPRDLETAFHGDVGRVLAARFQLESGTGARGAFLVDAARLD